MALDSKHPLYDLHVDDWILMRDTYAGERRIKDQTFRYLPPTSGMVEDGVYSGAVPVPMTRTDAAGMTTVVGFNRGNKGWEAYNAYRLRARYPDWVRESVKALLGVMHRKPPVIELPSQLEPLIERATSRGETMHSLLQRINEEQLVVGRVGLLADVFDDGPFNGQPYVAVYRAEDVLNWDEGHRSDVKAQALNLVVLNESGMVRREFEWSFEARYRVLMLGEAEPIEPVGVYRVGVFRDGDAFSVERMIVPSIGGRTADEIPFVFCNSADVVSDPDGPPLLGLANLCLGIYRGEADYRQSLFMQGQDTLVVIGSAGDADVRVGANARIDLPIGGDAKYIGVDSGGLPEQRSAIENDNKMAAQLSGQLLDSVSRERESGEALTVRVAARTATLNQVALAGAFALQSILRKIAKWMGANPEAVVVTPNLDFVDDQMTGEELGQIMGAKMLGAPLSVETIHRRMQDRGMTDLTFEEELAKIEEEKDLELVPAGASDPDAPEDDPEQVGSGADE